MQEFNGKIYTTISQIIEEGIMPNLTVNDTVAYTIDPVYGISRDRVDAEFTKALIRINKLSEKDYTPIIEKILNRLVQKQNTDGSWNEVHVKYDQPSVLVTIAILDGFVLLKIETIYQKGSRCTTK